MKIEAIKDTRELYKSGHIFNLTAFRKKRVMKIVLCAILLTTYAIVPSHAGTWRDDFDDINLNGWERIVEENPWFADWEVSPFTIGRFLAVIEKPEQKQGTAADFLHWNAHQFQLDKITVVGDEIRYPRVPNKPGMPGELCLFLGKRQPSPDFAEGYIFSPEKTTRIQFTENGVYKKGEVKEDYALMFRLTSEHLKVVFEVGKFQLWTQDLLITEFFDDDIPMIDVVGLISVCEFLGQWFDGTISTFSITGSGIPQYYLLDEQLREVQLRERQLTTTWGKLKRF
ncbi:MAG: hypothetical protein OXI43_19610 [Candidatus Poribacteria bacterium]|nr:hypothetical protein [Candidatus Poribacteria bacterium]